MKLADYRTVTANTGLDVNFADPRSLWRRATNENTNRIHRQYFPKGTSVGALMQDDFKEVAVNLRRCLTNTLDFQPPTDRFHALLRCPIESGVSC
jgi:IS30 family transposase